MTLSLNDIQRTLYDLRKEGRQTEELEALLIHSDDLQALFQAINKDGMDPAWNNFTSGSGEIKILGVKIIESQYVQKGSIFKIFKEDKPYVYPPEIGGSGVVPNSLLPMTTIPDFPPPVPRSGVTNYIVPDHLPIIVDEKREEEEKKHSLIRKIELN